MPPPRVAEFARIVLPIISAFDPSQQIPPPQPAELFLIVLLLIVGPMIIERIVKRD